MGMPHLSASGGSGDGRSAASQERCLQRVPLENRADLSNSPFLRNARESLVKWQLLDATSAIQALRENKLIFLHIGYQACHFSRVMSTECFSNPECAALLNEKFVPVIVDREERPEIDTIYMNYVQAVSASGGWPLNVFLTPELEPAFGTTFCHGPGRTRHAVSDHHEDRPNLLTILQKVSDIWRDQEDRCRKEAAETVQQLHEFAAEGTLGTRGLTNQPALARELAVPAPTRAAVKSDKTTPVSSELDLDQLEEAYTQIASKYDPVHGGFIHGGLCDGPKYLTPPKLFFLLRLHRHPSPVQDVVGPKECQTAAVMVIETLRKIRDGALHDHIGRAGFARCSVTADWSLPNFEKLVVDNSLLLALYLEAWKFSGGKPGIEFFDVVEELVDYLTSAPVVLPGGGLISSEAADSYHKRGDTELREGAHYIWTKRELDSVLDAIDGQISRVASAYWDIQEDGNVKEDYDPNDDFNQNIPRVVRTPESLATQFSIPVGTVEEYIRTARQELKTRRERERVRPALDDKVVTGWNGLAVSALARAAMALDTVASDKARRCLGTARATIAFVQRNLWNENTRELYSSWCDGRRGTDELADDYAYLILGLLDLFEATGDESLIEFADTLQKIQLRLFHDPAGGFFSTRASAGHVIMRLKHGMDTSLPSTNAVSADNLLRLGTLLEDDRFVAFSSGTVNAFEPEMLQHPWLFPGPLNVVVAARLGCDIKRAPVRYKDTRARA